jgi:uncharacterized protein YdeI (YjbR/CyaY-like superfamily)
MNIKVDLFLDKAKKWKEEMTLLREIVQECKLQEDFKWMHPCYTFDNNNVVLIHNFKEYCALLFFKGVLLNDNHGILIQQTENVQDRRQLRFTKIDEIIENCEIIKEYIEQAIALEKSGAQVVFKKTSEFKMPDEFQQKLDSEPKLKKAFESLTPGRQRAYLLYFSAAKQTQTRTNRIEKYIPLIMQGKGIDD